jgi:hypothetical protein
MYRSPLHCRCRLAHFISHIFPVLSLTSYQLPPVTFSPVPLYPKLYTVMNMQHSTCYVWLWYGDSRTRPLPSLWNPRFRISLLDPNFSSVSQTIIAGLAGFALLPVTTPYTLVPPHNNSSRGSNLRSTLYMWSSYWYGLITLQYQTKYLFLSHNQHSISVSPHYLIAQLRLYSPCRLFHIHSAVELTINRDIYKYVPWYHALFLSQFIQQSMDQFSKTQRSVTAVAEDELRWPSVSNKLPLTLILHLAESKFSLSPVAVVCVQSVECVEGNGRIDNSPIRTG